MGKHTYLYYRYIFWGKIIQSQCLLRYSDFIHPSHCPLYFQLLEQGQCVEAEEAWTAMENNVEQIRTDILSDRGVWGVRVGGGVVF